MDILTFRLLTFSLKNDESTEASTEKLEIGKEKQQPTIEEYIIQADKQTLKILV